MIRFLQSRMNRFTYADWKDYFEQNDAKRLVISFQNDTLTEEEKKLHIPDT